MQSLCEQVGAEWVALLLASEAQHGVNWLTNLHLGVALAEAGGVDEPRARFAASLAAQAKSPSN